MDDPYPDMQPGERTALEQFLDSQRRGVIRSLTGLTEDEASWRVLPATDLTIKGIVKHLAKAEDLWFHRKLLGRDFSQPWASAPFDEDPDWDFHSAPLDSIEELHDLYSIACERSRESAARFADLDTPAASLSFGIGPVNLRWIYVHMIEETAQHAGHLDLLRDALSDVRSG
jgi:uncharacterized damage-inducible protein DinB